MIQRIMVIFLAIICCLTTLADNWITTRDKIETLYEQDRLDEALTLTRPFANQGNDDAQNLMGCIYLDKKDILMARTWFEKALNKGNVMSMFNMGLTYDPVNTKGLMGVSWIPANLQNVDKAKEYYKMAMQTTDNSNKSKFDAYINTAIILFDNGDKQDAVNLLVSCLRKTEYATLRRTLARLYLNMDKPNDALRMYRIGAEYGDMNAMYELGCAYMNPENLKGAKISEDKIEAIKWFTKIAEINNPKFNDSWGSRTGRSMRYLTYLYSQLFNETYDENYLEQSLRWGIRADDIFADSYIADFYNDGLSDSKKFDTLEEWVEHLKNKYAIDSDIDMDVPVNPIDRRNTYALIIANENYEYEAKVPFASRDGNIFFKYTNQTLGIPIENIRLLTDVTLNKLKFEINWLKDMVDTHPNSSIIIYYAGHGLPAEDGSTSFLLPVDGFARNVNTGMSINELITSLSPKADRTMIILDACFSGAKRDGNMLTSARGIAIKQVQPQLENNTIVLSACSGTETAYAFNQQQHGMFTYFLLKYIKDNNGKVKLGDLSDSIIAEVKQNSMDVNGKLQTPSVSVSVNLQSSWRTMGF